MWSIGICLMNLKRKYMILPLLKQLVSAHKIIIDKKVNKECVVVAVNSIEDVQKAGL